MIKNESFYLAYIFLYFFNNFSISILPKLSYVEKEK